MFSKPIIRKRIEKTSNVQASVFVMNFTIDLPVILCYNKSIILVIGMLCIAIIAGFGGGSDQNNQQEAHKHAKDKSDLHDRTGK